MPKDYDFCGYATRNDLRCSDGRVIRKNAFAINDGKEVPLVYNHQHKDVENILGKAVLHNDDNGVYMYGYFNDTPKAKVAKEAVRHGDITSLSIWANNLKQNGSDVLHGVIREVSLVLAGSNPGAFIESVAVHGMPMDEEDEEGIIYTGENIIFNTQLQHADASTKDDGQSPKKENNDVSSDKTVGEIFEALSEEQKAAVAIIVEQAVSEKKENKEDDIMPHSIFDQESNENDSKKYLSHSDEEEIIKLAKDRGLKLSVALKEYVGDENVLAHAITVPTTGMVVPSGTDASATYGIKGISMLYPEYKTLNNPPEIIGRNMGWVQKVLSKVYRYPFERIKSVFADITADEARAKGYLKGDKKVSEVISTLNRVTEGQTIYKTQRMDRDDLIQITDFDVIPFIKQEMDVMLDEEKARAILIGDGRDESDRQKIKEDRIRPVVKDVDLFNTVVVVDTSSASTSTEKAEVLIDEIIRARKKYKGSGDPDFYTTEDIVSEMLLIKDKIGHRVYKTMEELRTTLRVKEIITVEPMEGYTLDENVLVGVIVNLTDYAVGRNPKGERGMFEDFDIDFNQQVWLKEERFSGALRKPFSALTICTKGTSEG